MSDSNEANILLEELEETSSLPLELDENTGLHKILSTEDSAKNEQAFNREQESNVNSASENGEEKNEDVPDPNQTSHECVSNVVVSDEALAGDRDAETIDTSETLSTTESLEVPEIVPNSETHVSSIPVDSEDCNIVSVGSVENSGDNGAALEPMEHSAIIKEEIIEDDPENDPLEHEGTSFSLSPSFEANLDPKFKPTIRLQKIDMRSGRIKEETYEDHDQNSGDNLSNDSDESSKDSSSHSRRPKRSRKTPVHLSNSFVLNPKDANAKYIKNSNTPASSKSGGYYGSLSSHQTPAKVVKIMKDNYVPIKPKTADMGTKSGVGTGKRPAISIVKSGSKPAQEVKTPVTNKQKTNEEFAKNIVRTLNADSVPSILKRSKRKADSSDDTTTQADSTSSTPVISNNTARKQKVEPPKKQQRRHRKIFDYESYLREHLEAEVNDKKPKSSDAGGEPFQLLSSLVGVNIPPSKIKVLPFSGNSNSTLKSGLTRKTNENDSNNIQSSLTKERTLYDMMQDVSNMLPSWNLHVMPDSNTFCVAQVCRGRSGIPTLKTSIELDCQFNAKVFIHQLHCKRYDGVYDSEESISALIQEIDALSK